MVHTKAQGSTLVFWEQMEVDKKHAAVTVGWRLLIEVRVWSQNCRNLPVRRRAAVVAFCLQVAKLCTGLLVDSTLFYILKLEIYCKFTRKNKMVALSVCLSQIWSASLSAGRRPDRWPQVCRVKITPAFKVYITTEELFHFHNNELEFDAF